MSEKLDRLSPFLGKPLDFHGVKVFSPTIEKIERVGESLYRLYLLFSLFDKEKIIINVLQRTYEEYEEIEEFDDYEVLVADERIITHVIEGISFFVKGKIIFNRENSSFLVNDSDNEEDNIDDYKEFINKDNYIEFSEMVRFLNGIDSKKEKMEFKNDRVKKKYFEMLKHKAKYEKPNQFELKDVMSVVCDHEGNGINIFNISSLTIYQLYESFERTSLKNEYKKSLALWSNTYTLKEGAKLAEWIVKTKF